MTHTPALALAVAHLLLSCTPADHDDPRQDAPPNAFAPTPSNRSQAAVARARSTPDTGTRVVVLGSGTPVPDPDRAGPALAVVVGEHAYLVDAGTGVVRRAARAAELGTAALSPERLDCVFVTHLHSDHTLGLADLMLTPAVVGRQHALQLFGPRGLPDMVSHLEAAYAVDLRVRAKAEGESPGYRFEPHGIAAGLVYRDERVRVSAFEVPHGGFPDALGYRFETSDRTIVVSGDTAPSDTLVQACNGCDLLVHEVYCEAGLRGLPEHVQAYHRAFHTSGPELAALAARARPKQLLLTHLLPFACTATALLEEVRAGFDSEVMLAEDLGSY